MKIVKTSYFRHPKKNIDQFKTWVNKLEKMNGYDYKKITIQTSLGKTQVYGLNTDKTDIETLIIFPGFRTTSLIWDLDKGLKNLSNDYRIFMVETNGQPNLSDGNTPSIKSLDYGKWGKEVFDELNIKSAFITGASFGGLICMKIALVIPERIKGAILFNPACFRFISLGLKNLYYNLLPIFRTNKTNIRKFLNEIVFNKPIQQISNDAEEHLIDYLELAITEYKDNSEKPYYMAAQLDDIKIKTHLIVGDKDILFPYKKSVSNAKKQLKENLISVHVEKSAHGIEIYKKAVNHIHKIIQHSR